MRGKQTHLCIQVMAEPRVAARRIREALKIFSEIPAAKHLGVGLRSLRRYRRRLEAAGLLDASLTPRGPRRRKDSRNAA